MKADHRGQLFVAVIAGTAALAALSAAGRFWTGSSRIAPPGLARPVALARPGSRIERRSLASTRLPLYDHWENFTVRDGLPSNKVFCVRAQGQSIWVGTDRGLACYDGSRWTHYSEADGLPHRVVLSLDVDSATGDLWIGTMGGLARFSAGRFDTFTQLTSGLSNDFVNAVALDPERPHLWVATAMGLCRYNLWTGEWSLFTQENTPMHEPWTYSVSIDRGLVYVGVWGGGILEYNIRAGRWREYRDPDHEMEIDLLPDDGPVHDVTAAVAFRGGVLWQATYAGLARYDGRQWQSYFQEDSPLPSNFINFVRARGRLAFLATDRGLAITDGRNWATWQRDGSGRGLLLLQRSSGRMRRRLSSIFPHNFVLGLDFQGRDIWLATEGGVSRGTISRRRSGAAGRRLSQAGRQ